MHQIEEDKKYLQVKVPIYGKLPLLETHGAQREHRHDRGLLGMTATGDLGMSSDALVNLLVKQKIEL